VTKVKDKQTEHHRISNHSPVDTCLSCKDIAQQSCAMVPR